MIVEDQGSSKHRSSNWLDLVTSPSYLESLMLPPFPRLKYVVRVPRLVQSKLELIAGMFVETLNSVSRPVTGFVGQRLVYGVLVLVLVHPQSVSQTQTPNERVG